jgi:hypothetical protein
MYLIHISTIKTESSVCEITVYIVVKGSSKKYTFKLSSEYGASLFHRYYRMGWKMHGKALSVLNKFKEVSEDEKKIEEEKLVKAIYGEESEEHQEVLAKMQKILG